MNISINKYIYEFIKSNIILFLVYIFLLGVYPLQKIILPKFYGKAISNISNKNLFIKNIKNILIIFGIIQILYSLNYISQGYLIPRFTEYATINIFNSVIKSYNYDYDNVETGKILAKLIKIQNVFFGYFDSIRIFIFSQIFVLISALIHYFQVSKKLALYFSIIIITVFILQYYTFKFSLKYDLNREVNKDKIYEHCEDVFNNLISVFICKQQNQENNLLINKFKPYTKSFLKCNIISFNYRILYSIFNIFVFIFINYYLLKLYLNKKINKTVFISSFIITFSLLNVISDSYYGIKKFMENYSQVKDLQDYFNEKIELQNKLSNQKNNYLFKNGPIIFQNVFYKYDGIHKFALNNVSFKINKGDKIALIGEIGSGKSTCAKLLLKLLPYNIGKITINNIDINDISLTSLRNHIFYIPQNPKLLNRTLFENITYGLPTNQNYQQKIFNVLQSFKIYELNNVFKDKMFKTVGNNGSHLSGGQRQIVWLLRAFLRNSDIIVLDEPTASLDQKSKQIVFNFIQFIGKNKTIIIITHDNINDDYKKIYFNNSKIIF